MPGTYFPFPFVPLSLLFSIISTLHPLRRKTRWVIYEPRRLGMSGWGRSLGVASPGPTEWLRYIPLLFPRLLMHLKAAECGQDS